MDDEEPIPDEAVLPAKLRWIAEWLDFTDRYMASLVTAAAGDGNYDAEYISERMAVLASNELQGDLRRWADLLETGETDPRVVELAEQCEVLRQRISVIVGDDEVGIRKLHMEGGNMDAEMAIPHWAANLFAASFADSLITEGATNFLELSFATEKGRLLVTIHSPEGQTPAVLLAAEKAKVAKLEALVSDAATVIKEAQSDRAIHSYRVGSALDITVKRLEAASNA